jgi:hypothetical protein
MPKGPKHDNSDVFTATIVKESEKKYNMSNETISEKK